MILEELLRAAKDIYEKGGTARDIYSLITDIDDGKYPLAKYGSLNGDLLIENLHFKNSGERHKFKKEAEQQYEERYDEALKLINSVETNIKEKYPSIVIENHYPEMKFTDAIGIDADDHFISAKCCLNVKNDAYNQYSEIKLYFNMSFDKMEEFFKEYTSFVIENNMFSFFKTRYENSNDMVTVRFKEVEKLDDIVNIIKKYKNNDKISPLVDTYDGIGFTVDNGESFNLTLSNLLYEYVSETSSVDKDSFTSYLSRKKDIAELPKFSISTKEQDTLYVHLLNLNNIINNKKFNIDEFKNRYLELVLLEKNEKLSKKLKNEYVSNTINMLAEIGYENEQKMYEAIDKLFDDTSNTVELNGQNIKAIDIINEYYSGRSSKEELTKSIVYSVEEKKRVSIREIRCKISDFLSAIIVETAKLGFEDEELMVQGIDSVINNDKIVYNLNGSDLKIVDFINYYMVDYISDKGTKKLLLDMSNKMISFTNKLYDYISEKDELDDQLLYRKIHNITDDYTDEVEDDDLGRLDVYEMTKKLLAYKFGFEDSINPSFQEIVRNRRLEKGPMKVKEK